MVMSDQGKCLIDIIDDPNALEEFFAKKAGPQPSEQGGTLPVTTSARSVVMLGTYKTLMVGSKPGSTMSTSHNSATVSLSRSATELPSTVQQLLLPSVVSGIAEGPHSGAPGMLAVQAGTNTPVAVKPLPNIQPKTVVSSVQPTGTVLQTSAPLLTTGVSNAQGKAATAQPVNIVNIMPKQAAQQHQPLQAQQQQLQLQQLQSQPATVQQAPVQIGGGNFIIAPQGMHQFMINGQPVRLHFVQTPVLQAGGGSGGFIIPYAAAGQQQPAFSIVPGMSTPQQQQQPAQQLQQQQMQQQQQLQQQLQQLQFVGQASQLRSMGQPINVMAVANQTTNGAAGAANMIALPPNIIQLQLPSAAAVSGTATGQTPAYICSPLTSRSSTAASVPQRMAVSGLPNLAPATSVAPQGSFALSSVYGSNVVALSKQSNDTVSATASNVSPATISMQSSSAPMSSTLNQTASAEGWVQAQGSGASTQPVQLLRDHQTQALYEQALKLQREQLAAAVVSTASMSTAPTAGQPMLTVGNAGVRLTTASTSGSKPTATQASSVASAVSQPSQQLQGQPMLLPVAPGVVAVPTQAQQMLAKIQNHINLLKNLPTTSEEQNTTLQQLQTMQQQIIAQVVQKQQQPQQLQLQSLRPTQASVAIQQAAVTASAIQAQTVPTQMVYIAGGPAQPPAVADGHSGNIPSLLAALRTVKIGLQTYTVQLTDEQLRAFADQLAKMPAEQQKEFIKRQQAQLVMAALNRQRLVVDGTAGTTASSQPTVQLPVPVASASAAQVPSAPVDRLAARLRQDQAAVLKPDTKTAFSSLDDACRRLLRYHVYQHRSPSQDDYCQASNAFEVMSRGLLQRKCTLVDKFRELLWKASLQNCPSSELVQVSKILLEDERQQITADRAMALHNSEQFVEIYGRSHLERESKDAKLLAGANAAIDSRRHLSSECGEVIEEEVKLEDNAQDGTEILSPIEEYTPSLDIDSDREQKYSHDVETKPKVKVKEERTSSAGIPSSNRAGISPLVLLPKEGVYRRSSTPIGDGGSIGAPKQSKCAIFSETIKSEQIADASFDGDPPSHGALRNAVGQSANATRDKKRIGDDLHHLSPPPIKIRIAKPRFGQEQCGASESPVSPGAARRHEDSRPPASDGSTSTAAWLKAAACTARPTTGKEVSHGDGGESDCSDRIYDDDDGCGGPEEGSSEIEVDDDGDDGRAESLRLAAASVPLMLPSASTEVGYDWRSASSAGPSGPAGLRHGKQPNGDVAGSLLQSLAVGKRASLQHAGIEGRAPPSLLAYDDGERGRLRLTDDSEAFSGCVPGVVDYAYESLAYADGDDALRLGEVRGAVMTGPEDEAEEISAALAAAADAAAPTDLYQNVAFDDGACDDELKNALESIK